MVLGDEMREDDPTNLASAWKKASYGLDTVDLRRAWPGPGPAERDVVLLFLPLPAIPPEAGGVASLPLLPVPVLPVRRCSGGTCDSDAIMSCGSGSNSNPGCDVRIFSFA